MRGSTAAREFRKSVPLGAFLSLTTLATLLSAQARLACTRQMTMDMPGMDMSSMAVPGGVISLCPIVLALSIASIILTLNAFVLLLLDRRRLASSRSLARFVLRLPFSSTCATIGVLGCGAVATMMAVDGTAPNDAAAWLCLAGIILATAVAATLVAIGLGRLVLALTRRMVLALERAIQHARRSALRGRSGRLNPIVPIGHRIHVLAAYRGLRAPPVVR